MGKRQPNTPRSRVRQSLRQLWLRSRERAAAIKREGNCCEVCGKKGSKAKGKEVAIEVHHIEEIGNWDETIDAVYKTILVSPVKLKVLCKECHSETHKEGK